MTKYIWRSGRRYYYYGSYDSWKDAYNVARKYKKENRKCQYYIIKVEAGYWFPQIKYKLYMTKVIRLGLLG